MFSGILAIFFLLYLSFPAQSAEDWQSALQGNTSPLARKLLTWFYVTETDIPVSTKDLIRFTRENSGWPKLHEFRKRIEEDIANTLHPYETAEWFDQNSPKGADGAKVYIGTLLRLGQEDKARAALKKFWLAAELDKGETRYLANQFRKLFSATDHIDRLDTLLWSARYQESEYMLGLVDTDHRHLAEARMALGRLSSKAPKLLHAVPTRLQNDSGLLHDRLKWRRQMNKDNDAFDLLQQAPKNASHPEIWWRERNILARRALEKNDYSRAYKIILNHQMTPGVEYSQAEWLLGWISLRFLHQPDKAYRHFDNFYLAVNSAVSRSRGAYWLARASEALKQPEAARNWDKLGAQFTSTFYGQLCYEKLYGPLDATQLPDEQVLPEAQQAFEQQEMVQVIRLFSRLDLRRYTDTFFIKLLDKAKDRPDFILIARLAREIHHPRFSVEANKQLQQKLGDFMFTEGYPLLPSLHANQPEKALIHAIVHRESMFDTTAESPAGARGLMQLMPATAKQVSRSIGKNFTIGKLTENPRYNVELGAAYLQSLLEDYNGFYPLAIAAYNAGPNNVKGWLREFGDPRRGKVDLIDWIEQIPIYETRNYVQRVMESYYIYKLRLSEKPQTVMGFKRG